MLLVESFIVFQISGFSINIIVKPMSSPGTRHPNGLQTSLDFDKEFTYINMIQDEISKDKKRSRLKIMSKLSRSPPTKKNNLEKKKKNHTHTSHSLERKKSKTTEKSNSKKKISDKKSLSKNLSNTKRQYKTQETKINENKGKPLKTVKTAVPKNTHFEQSSKRQYPSGRKKKAKDELIPKIHKQPKTVKTKSTNKVKLQKTLSVNELDKITLSQISRQPKLGSKQQKVMHEYFGMSDKLSSILQQKKDQKLKRNQSKLSKCKTQSSSSSLTIKSGIKFNKKSTKQKK